MKLRKIERSTTDGGRLCVALPEPLHLHAVNTLEHEWADVLQDLREAAIARGHADANVEYRSWFAHA